MHTQSALQLLHQEKEKETGPAAVTSECGIQAASDTVCRGSQVTPLTRDAGCQYEECPVPTRPAAFAPSIIKPSPIKHSSPPRDHDAMYMAAKALQQLQQNSASSLLGSESVLQSQIKAMQSQAALSESLKQHREDGDRRFDGSSGGSESNLGSLLQPGLMGSLPLTSYALLLDMLNTQNNPIPSKLAQLQHLSKQGSFSSGAVTGNLVKPSPSLLTSGGLCSASSASSILGSTTPLSSLTSPLFAGKGSPLNPAGGLLNGGGSYFGTNTTGSSVPTMLKPGSTNHKRVFSGDQSSKRESVDIDSLMNSVIEEHMNGKKQDHSTSHRESVAQGGMSGGPVGCLYSRADSLNDYEQMTPPFKRRRRTVFTERQLQGLEEAYSKSQYLDRESRLELCKKLSLSLHTVVYWFQNKRAISRRRGQTLENGHSNGGGSEFSDCKKSTSPSFKQTPPHSPNSMEFVTSQYSPLKASMVRSRLSPAPSLITSPPSSVMSSTLTTTSGINKGVLNINQMVGATI